MASNTFKVNQPKEKVKAPAEKGKSIFSFLDSYFRVDQIFQKGLHIKYLPQILFTTFMLIVYIGISHNMERNIRKIDKLQIEVEDLRADFTTRKADYMHASMQSEVAKKLKVYGIEESVTPPIKLEVDDY